MDKKKSTKDKKLSNEECENPTTRKKTSLVTYLVLLFIALVVTFWMSGPYLLAILSGVICALILRPMYIRLQRRKCGPRLAAGLSATALTLVLIGPVAGFIVAAVDEGINVSKYVNSEQFPTFSTIAEYVTRWKPVESVAGDAPAVEKQIRSGIQTAAKAISAGVLAVVGSIPELGLQLFLVILTCYFCLVDGRTCLNWLKDRVPLDRDVRERLIASFRDTAISSIWATIAAGLTQAAVMLFAFLVLGVPAAFLAAGTTFIFSWIPILGSTPIWIIGTIYLYTKGSMTEAVLMVVFGILCGVSDNLVRPLVLKGRDDMHPLISLISIFGGIYLFGILGVFFGPIVYAIALSMLNVWPAVAERFELVDPECQ